MTPWTFAYDEYNPGQEQLREALCTLGNGYFASRGAAPEASADDIHYPGTYVSGCYNRLSTEIAGKVVENESLVNLPNWLLLTFRIGNGDWFNLTKVEILAYHQALDFKKGILTRRLRFRDHTGRHTTLEQHRLVHMYRTHLATMQTRFVAEDWAGDIEIYSALDGQVVNAGVERYKQLNNRHLEVLTAQVLDKNSIYLKVRTNQSRIQIAQAARCQFYRNDKPLGVDSNAHKEQARVGQYFTIRLPRGVPIVVEKTIAMYTSRDPAIYECGLEARKAVKDADRYGDLAKDHCLLWEQLWRRFDFEIHHTDREQQDRAARILRLHIFHLLQICSPNTMDLDVGIPARGLHGEAYRGHIFWDELFVFPLLNLRIPETTRALLKYRYRRLDEARRAARKAGYRGAIYPWQSGSNGREESQEIHLNPQSGRWIPDNSRLQRHVNAAIAYNIWQHYQVTHDLEFIAYYGAEMILEIARFWASITIYNKELGRYEIKGVMGPDEYHDSYPDAQQPGLNNNAYTNVMAVWVLCRALELPAILPAQRWQELCELLELEQVELDLWDAISRKMRLIFHDDGIISQFEGYDALEEFDWTGYREKYGDIQRLDRILEAENDTPNRYKVSKQADVLMLFYLFSAEELGELFTRLDYSFEYQTIPRNIDYYSKRTSHGSTLSRIVHSWVLARANRAGAWQLFYDALESDVADIQGGTTAEGIHTGAMAGSVDLIQRCFSGIETRGDVLWLNPCLPHGLDSLTLHIHYRQQTLGLYISNSHIRINTKPSAEQPLHIGIQNKVHELQPGQEREFELHPGNKSADARNSH